MRVLYRYSLIITILFVLLNSCVPPKSVRPTGAYFSSNRKPIKQKKIDVISENQNNSENDSIPSSEQNIDLNNQVRKNQNAIAGLNEDDSTISNYDETIIQELPSLNEQLRMLSAQQTEIQNDLAQIKNVLGDLESRVNKLENNVETTNKPTNKFDNIILPDETVKSDKKNYKRKNTINSTNSNFSKPVKNQDDETTNDLQEQINEIKNIIKQRDYSTAINELQQLVKNTKDPVTINLCYFYLGESHYGMKQYDKAIDFYKKVINSGDATISDDALVKVAEANVNLGNLKSAKKYFEELVARFPKSENTPYARKMLQKI